MKTDNLENIIEYNYINQVIAERRESIDDNDRIDADKEITRIIIELKTRYRLLEMLEGNLIAQNNLGPEYHDIEVEMDNVAYKIKYILWKTQGDFNHLVTL